MMDCLSCVDAVDMDDCLIEVCRVLKENDGYLYVGEYESSGSYDDMLRVFHDLSAVRTWTLDAQRRLSQDVVASVREIHYGLRCQYSDFESFVASFTAVNGPELMNANMHSKNVRALFEQSRKGNIFEFEQARRVNLYRTGSFAPAGA